MNETNLMNDAAEFPKRKNMRMRGYDYSLPGDYFVTIVTHQRRSLFGKIEDGEMQCNDAGRMVEACYKELQTANGDIVCLEHVVMPNHLHFVLHLNAETYYLPELVKRLKSKTTLLYMRGVRDHGWPPFSQHLWQKGYYEHIIRHQRVYDFIRSYILNNPARWKYDEDNLQRCDAPDDINREIKNLMP